MKFEGMRLPIFSDDGTQKRYATPEEIAISAINTEQTFISVVEVMVALRVQEIDGPFHRVVERVGTNEGQIATTIELGIMLLLDRGMTRLANPRMTQLELNKMAGRIADENAALILAQSDVEVIGSQVTAKIGDKVRYIDKLAKTPGGQIVNVEVKADNAIRGARQVTFDDKMATQGAVLGKNAPAELQGATVVMRTYVLRVSTKPR